MTKKLVLYTFIDAFGYEIYKQHPYFLKDIITDKQSLKSVLGFTNTCLPSILSGKYPQEHKQASLFFYSDNSPFKWMRALSFLPGFFDRFRVRNILSKLVKRLHNYTGYFQLYSIPFDKLAYFDFTEKRDYFVPGAPFNTIFDYCVENNIDYHCSNWRKSEEENLDALNEQIQEAKIKFAWLYLPSLDGTMHMHGTQSIKTEEKIQLLDKQITKAYNEALKHYDEVSLYVFSDHGMYDVTKGYDVIKDIDSLGLKYGEDYVAMYDSTMARFWFKNPLAKEKIIHKLSQIEDGEILSDKALKEVKTYFEDGHFGELFFLMDPSVMINPSYFGKNLINGMHGYHPNASGSNAMLLSNQSIDNSIVSITDIRKTMEQELAV
ncbi:MAG: putative AlkP superfamily pyrophosphatase or phosphodiesterase [Sulfurimonas sp.]|jgi:predicted AlkP superfamily pyrophosphatase or phosphodiesterase|uniref:alkaline phosphatase family protein n=1 Tax=Sulfurimonas sp. TaxID=2022749 RepID=UPI0039E3C911